MFNVRQRYASEGLHCAVKNGSPYSAEERGGRQSSLFNANHSDARVTNDSEIQVGAVQEEPSRDCLEPFRVERLVRV